MKKNISVNLQGMIFHVEEDGYELLSQYLTSIKTYFSSYEGHEEIVADIESRIAEIFFARLNPGKQVITREDVQALITQMGTITDFELEEPEETHTSSSSAQAESEPQPAASPEQKRLYRDVNRKVVAGVSAGIANYLQIDPLWARLAFVLMVIGVPFTGGFTLFGLLLYVICWIALPKNEALPDIPVRKLFRDPVDKKLGGVAGGIAIYFGVDVALVRLLFLICFFVFGTGFLIYIILWIAVPEAKSITERVQMQGNPVTLSSIEESVKNTLHMKDANGEESPLAKALLFPVRLVSQIIQALSRGLFPLIGIIVNLVRVFAGLMLLMVASAFIIALLVVLGVATGLFADSEFIQVGDLPAEVFLRSVPAWGIIAGFFASIIPSILLFILGIGMLTKRFFVHPTVRWTMFGIWLLSVAGLTGAVAVSTRNFQEYGEYTIDEVYRTASYPTLLFNLRESAHNYGDNFDFEIEGYNGPDVKIIQTYKSRGLNEANAIKNAQMISYKVLQQDSVIRFDDAFTFKSNAIFRDQNLSLKVFIPEGKKIRFSEGFVYHFGNAILDDTYSDEEMRDNVWQMKNGHLVCVTCSMPDSVTGVGSPSVAKTMDTAFTDDFSILQERYDGKRLTYKARDFSNIDASGAYHIRVIKSHQYSVKAQGNEDALDRLKISSRDGTLHIETSDRFMGFLDNSGDPVYIEIQTPELTEVELSGAIKAEIGGFTPDNFRLQQTGATEVALQVITSELTIDQSGAAKIFVKGTAEHLAVDGSGACKLEASQLFTNRANLDFSGASNAVVNVKDELFADASGASKIQYLGNPGNVQVDQSGASKISRRR